MKARVCEGCKKPRGTIPIAMNGYWHLPCWRRNKKALAMGEVVEWQTLMRTGVCHAFGKQEHANLRKAVCGAVFPLSDNGLVEPLESDLRCRSCVRNTKVSQ